MTIALIFILAIIALMGISKKITITCLVIGIYVCVNAMEIPAVNDIKTSVSEDATAWLVEHTPKN